MNFLKIILIAVFAILAYIGATSWIDYKKTPDVVPTPEQVKAKAETDWNEVNTNNGRNISLWVDKKHGVVCWIISPSGQYSQGISCLPRSYVMGVPY